MLLKLLLLAYLQRRPIYKAPIENTAACFICVFLDWESQALADVRTYYRAPRDQEQMVLLNVSTHTHTHRLPKATYTDCYLATWLITRARIHYQLRNDPCHTLEIRAHPGAPWSTNAHPLRPY